MSPEVETALGAFAHNLRRPGWNSLFPALESLCQTVIGHRLFSCSAFRLTSPASGDAARIYSSDPVHYPVSGVKEIVPNRWTDSVIGRGEVFVANSVAGFADVFPDHALIASLGLGSVVNLPVIWRGTFLGTVNMLHAADYYSDVRLRPLASLTLPATLAFLATEQVNP